MFRKKGTALAVFDPEFNKTFKIFKKILEYIEGKNHSGELLVLFSSLILVGDSRVD